nr:MAG TPA: hypothetical protein [Caudoviricetes sp.]
MVHTAVNENKYWLWIVNYRPSKASRLLASTFS